MALAEAFYASSKIASSEQYSTAQWLHETLSFTPDGETGAAIGGTLYSDSLTPKDGELRECSLLRRKESG
jgi:hypothetical protein